MGTDALDQIKRVFRIAVQVNDDHVEVIAQDPGDFPEVGRVGDELLDLAILAFAQSANRGVAALLVRADDRNR